MSLHKRLFSPISVLMHPEHSGSICPGRVLRLSFITQFPSPPLRMMVNPWIASSQKLIQETGYEFIYSTRDAFEDFARSVNASDH